MNWVWNDGGRAASGFVGTTGDCVVRAISIATGRAYRDVYAEIGEQNLASPRAGVYHSVSSRYLERHGWQWFAGQEQPLNEAGLPDSVAIAHVRRRYRTSQGHYFAIVNGTVHDTWNATEDDDYVLLGYWFNPHAKPHIDPSGRELSEADQLTQTEFEKVMRRLRAMDRTAQNDASTEGERRNALRAMQSLMLKHNLSADSLREDATDGMLMTRIAVPLNGRRMCGWERHLAYYLTSQVFSDVQHYRSVRGHRSLVFFYGPTAGVENCVALFRELLLTIAASAKLKYGGYARGSGASYAEGYVDGLPRADGELPVGSTAQDLIVAERRLTAARAAARQWLATECDIRLYSGSSSGRHRHDPHAEAAGKADGSKQEIKMPEKRLKIGFSK